MTEVDRYLDEQQPCTGAGDDHFLLLYPSDYLRACDLKGQGCVITIGEVRTKQELQGTDGRQKEVPMVLTIAGKDKKLVVNKTNARSIAEFLGVHFRQWAGKKIELYPTTCRAFGKTVDCIRVREPGSGQ